MFYRRKIIEHSREQTSEQTHEQARETLWRLVKDIKFGMLTTYHRNGHLHSRPVTTQNRDIDALDSLWFFMSRGSEPVADLRTDAHVNVAYADPGKDAYVSVSGEARIVDDMARKAALWTPFAQAWFPGGVEDPDLALVQVKIVHAHYWDVKASKIVQLYTMAKAALTGQKPEGMGEEGEVRMRGHAG